MNDVGLPQPPVTRQSVPGRRRNQAEAAQLPATPGRAPIRGRSPRPPPPPARSPPRPDRGPTPAPSTVAGNRPPLPRAWCATMRRTSRVRSGASTTPSRRASRPSGCRSTTAARSVGWNPVTVAAGTTRNPLTAPVGYRRQTPSGNPLSDNGQGTAPASHRAIQIDGPSSFCYVVRTFKNVPAIVCR